MSLYLEHFGLREPPFRITPHTDFFFTGANRGPTLDALIYAITQDEGIVKVTGEVGSGKTMLCRMLLERLPERQRLPIVHVKIHGLSVVEAARASGMSESAVKVGVHRGLKALAAMIRDKP